MSKTLQFGSSPLRYVSKEQGVHDLLRSAITSGEMKPGQRLICADIGEELGVSSMPVRNALMRLEVEGLVTRIPHREFVVKPYSPEDIRELYAVRTVLDSFAGRLAAERMTPGVLNTLRSLLLQAEKALSVGEIASVQEANSQFHTALCVCAKNAQLLDVIQALRCKSQAYMECYYGMPGVAEHCIEEHQQLISALEQGKVDMVEVLMRQEMEGTGTALLRLAEEQAAVLNDTNLTIEE